MPDTTLSDLSSFRLGIVIMLVIDLVVTFIVIVAQFLDFYYLPRKDWFMQRRLHLLTLAMVISTLLIMLFSCLDKVLEHTQTTKRALSGLVPMFFYPTLTLQLFCTLERFRFLLYRVEPAVLNFVDALKYILPSFCATASLFGLIRDAQFLSSKDEKAFTILDMLTDSSAFVMISINIALNVYINARMVTFGSWKTERRSDPIQRMLSRLTSLTSGTKVQSSRISRASRASRQSRMTYRPSQVTRETLTSVRETVGRFFTFPLYVAFSLILVLVVISVIWYIVLSLGSAADFVRQEVKAYMMPMTFVILQSLVSIGILELLTRKAFEARIARNTRIRSHQLASGPESGYSMSEQGAPSNVVEPISVVSHSHWVSEARKSNYNDFACTEDGSEDV